LLPAFKSATGLVARNRLGPIAGSRREVDSVHADIDAVLNMAPTDQETEVVPPAQEPEEMPLPSDPTVIFLGGLFVLALLAAAYIASEIVLPLVFAIILKLLLQPSRGPNGLTAPTVSDAGTPVKSPTSQKHPSSKAFSRKRQA
jgi:hypothetical protein